MRIVRTTSREISERKELHFNEKKRITNHCQEVTIELAKRGNDAQQINLIFRVYNEGVAFRYVIPAQTAPLNAVITNELTEFSFTHTNLTIFQESWTESGYFESNLNSLTSHNEMPATIRGANLYCLINEADNQNYSRVRLKKTQENTLQMQFTNGNPAFSGGLQTPWRYIVLANSAVALAKSKYLVYKLNNDNALGDLSWIKPGKVFRVMNLTTQSAIECINFAKATNIEYILFDAGWYGFGYDEQYNVRSDPTKVIPQIDMPAVMSHAQAQGIGVILYVNEVAFKNYNIDGFFNLYRTWGIKGIKLGFVEGRTQRGIAFQHEIIRKAAQYRFVLNIHDEYRPSGTSQIYPNLLTVEGIRGNEYRTNTAQHTTTLPFTRLMTGAGDYTICYKDPNSQNSLLTALQTTKAHQLALNITVFSPLQHVLWYGIPQHYTNATEIEYFKAVPTVWDDTKILNGEIGRYVTIARRSGNKWFVGALNGLTARSVSVPLDFLGSSAPYRVISYEDNNGSIKKEVFEISRTAALQINMTASGGKVFILESTDNYTEPEPEEDLLTEKPPVVYEPAKDWVYPVPAAGFIHLNLPASLANKSTLILSDFSGRIIDQWSVNQAETELSVDKYTRGMYVLTLIDENNIRVYTRKIVLQ